MDNAHRDSDHLLRFQSDFPLEDSNDRPPTA